MIYAKPVFTKNEKDSYFDIVLFEHGEYSKPIRIITSYDATNLCINLFNCLSKDDKNRITINKPVED